MNSQSLMFHSAAWAFASAARAFETALELQKQYVGPVTETGAQVGAYDPTSGDDKALAAQRIETEEPPRKTSVSNSPPAPEPASRLIARARRSIQSRHAVTER